MKIQREINGQVVEIELTSDELYSAYLEKEHEYDRQDIQDELESYNFNDETCKDFFDIYGIPLDKVFGNDELISEIAYEKRHNQDHYGMEWTYARDDALKDVLYERKLELRGLPERCYNTLPSTGELIIISRGGHGYTPVWPPNNSNDAAKNQKEAKGHNAEMGVSNAQAAAMLAGSMFGWDVPAADPNNYDENGVPKPLEKPSLETATAIEYKGIVFDNWTVDEETGGVWGEMCQCCAEKYKDLLKDELEDGGCGACSVKGCDVVGDDDDIEMFYVDFKPEIIKPLNREQLLALEGGASLADKITDARSQVISSAEHSNETNNFKER